MANNTGLADHLLSMGCGAWRPMHEAFDLDEHTLIVAIYRDWSGGEILLRCGDTLVDLGGEPSSMLPDLGEFQVIGVERCPHEAATPTPNSLPKRKVVRHGY